MDPAATSELLTLQHRQIDRGIKEIIDGGSRLAELGEALLLLREHIFAEETLLFPPLAKAGLTMPVFVMKREHGQMWPLLESLSAACADTVVAESVRGNCDQLFRLLQMHNTKEEQIVYAAVDQLCDDPLIEAIENARAPDGWTCAMAPH